MFSKFESCVNRWLPVKNIENVRQRYGVFFLNIAQFFGVVNDNLFKYLIVFLFIDLKGIEASPVILTWVGIVYVVPFLIFSSLAGTYADRFSKQRMIILLKLTEFIIVVLGVIAFIFKHAIASYSLLFLLAAQSAFFGPPKYSVIPELVNPKEISKANGTITSWTYLAIIFGTFLASILTQITDKNFVISSCVCVLFAVVGWLSSICIPYTPSQKCLKKAHPFFIYEVYKSMRLAAQTPRLVPAIVGSAAFLFFGAYFQLNIIPYAVNTLGYSDVAGGYLFLLTAIGIAAGSFMSGRLSARRPEIGLACLSGLALAALTIVLGGVCVWPTCVFITVIGLGFFGGIYIVPFDAYIQKHAPSHSRGKIVAASNFLSFCGVLIAPLLLYVLSEVFGLSSAQGFIIVGCVVVGVVIAIGYSVFQHCLNYFVRIILRIFGIKVIPPKDDSQQAVMLCPVQENVWKCLAVAAYNPEMHIYIIRVRPRWCDRVVLCWMKGVSVLYFKEDKQGVIDTVAAHIAQRIDKDPSCIMSMSDDLVTEDSVSLWRQRLNYYQVSQPFSVADYERTNEPQHGVLKVLRPLTVVKFILRKSLK